MNDIYVCVFECGEDRWYTACYATSRRKAAEKLRKDKFTVDQMSRGYQHKIGRLTDLLGLDEWNRILSYARSGQWTRLIDAEKGTCYRP